MASSKPSGLARFTRQASSPRSTEPASASPVNDEDVLTPTVGGAAGPRGGAKAKLVGVYLMPDGHRQLKVEAAKRGVTISDLVREAVNTWFTNEDLPPLA